MSREDIDAEVVEIAEKATKWAIWNVEHGVTGALLFTGQNFAQILEGHDQDVERLLSKIVSDPRHENVLVVDRSGVTARRFPDWGMAYMGPSQFVARHVSLLLTAPSRSEEARAANWLAELMHEFRKPQTALSGQVAPADSELIARAHAPLHSQV